MVIANFLQKRVKCISRLHGGFPLLHNALLTAARAHPPTHAHLALLDHMEERCLVCTPIAQQTQRRDSKRSMKGRAPADSRDSKKDAAATKAAASGSTLLKTGASFFDRLKSKSAQMKEIVVNYIKTEVDVSDSSPSPVDSPPKRPPPTKAPAKKPSKKDAAKPYRNLKNVFSIADSGDGERLLFFC